MTRLSDAQIAEYVRSGGFAGNDVVIGVAVVLAESGGDTEARGDVPLMDRTWGPSIGLFQIRSLKAERGSGGVRDELANLDPGTNARHAHRVYLDAGSRWTPWSTFTNGRYLGYLERARPAATGHGGVVPPGGRVHVVAAGDTLSSIARMHGVTLARIRELNPGLFDADHRHGDLIRPGERVVLAGQAPAGHAPVGHSYVVRDHDTLSGIAQAHGLTLDRIRQLNPGLFDSAHHSGDLIRAGEVVRL